MFDLSLPLRMTHFLKQLPKAFKVRRTGPESDEKLLCANRPVEGDRSSILIKKILELEVS